MMEDGRGEIANGPAPEPRLTVAERTLLRSRSDAYRQNPGAAIPLDEALDRIERSVA
ncbi:hypothetical protein [Longimicrobium sp.]|uniref:hypothetical protein n=1 Tax=Longimicrobium sp. TaxID=2029185 RepID=UPI002C0697C1|nr:hypothetical protein [Longimicrobium sp.]HSU17513.1 hypothetical protein [Longimicrobium sp.]